MKNLPEWINTLVASIVLGGMIAGVWSSARSEIAVLTSEIRSHEVRINKNVDYDGVLTEDLFELKDRVTKVETGLDYWAKSHNQLHGSLKELNKQLQQMNNTLIKLDSRGQ